MHEKGRKNAVDHPHFLSSTCDDEDRNVILEHARRKNIDMADVEDAAVGFEACGSVLLGQGRVDRVLGCREPKFECLYITLDICIQNLC